MTPREALLARYSDPSRPPFPEAVQIVCDDCQRFIVWSNPPEPQVPTSCGCRPTDDL